MGTLTACSLARGRNPGGARPSTARKALALGSTCRAARRPRRRSPQTIDASAGVGPWGLASSRGSPGPEARSADPGEARGTSGLSIARLIDQRPRRDPRHHGPQFLADLLNGVRGQARAHGFERRLIDFVLEHPIARERS
jgi:hypothetical protein